MHLFAVRSSNHSKPMSKWRSTKCRRLHNMHVLPSLHNFKATCNQIDEVQQWYVFFLSQTTRKGVRYILYPLRLPCTGIPPPPFFSPPFLFSFSNAQTPVRAPYTEVSCTLVGLLRSKQQSVRLRAGCSHQVGGSAGYV